MIKRALEYSINGYKYMYRRFSHQLAVQTNIQTKKICVSLWLRPKSVCYTGVYIWSNFAR